MLFTRVGANLGMQSLQTTSLSNASNSYKPQLAKTVDFWVQTIKGKVSVVPAMFESELYSDDNMFVIVFMAVITK